MYWNKRVGLYLPNDVRPKASGYSEAGASLYRRALKSFTPRSASPSEDIDLSNHTMRQRCRMLYMSSPLATGAVNTNRTKAVGVGLTLKSSIDREILGLSPEAAKDWQKRTEAEFRLWAGRKDACDAAGVNDFNALQQLAFISWLMSGDVFALFKRREPDPRRPYLPYSLRIQLIEADLVRTPTEYGGAPYPQLAVGRNPEGRRIFDGVEVDDSGMITAYYVHSTYLSQRLYETDEWTRVEAYGERTGLPNILHVMSSERPGQYRGVSYLAQAVEPILQLNRYINSALTMALVQSFFTAWVILKSHEDEFPGGETGDMDEPPGPSGPGAGRRERSNPNEVGMGPGEVRVLKEDEDIKFGNPTMPVPGFSDFVGVFCKLVGAGLGVPHDVLVKEYNASYSASRAALLDAWEEFRMRRRWFVDDFCQPVYEMWLAEAVALGRIKAPGFFTDPLLRAAWCGAKWIGPAPGSIDPLKEAEAAVLQIQHALKTHDQVTTELTGGDWEKNAALLRDENERLLEAGGGNVQITMALNDRDNDKGGDAE